MTPTVIDHIRFGFPVNVTDKPGRTSLFPKNHAGAGCFPVAVEHYLLNELSCGAVLGPFASNPFPVSCHVSPLNSVPKRDSQERRIIVDLSFPPGASVNSVIPKDTYLGAPVKLTFPSVDNLVALVRKHGCGCALFKRDLPMGLRSAALCCQQVTNLISHVCALQGIDTINYLDDFGGADDLVTADLSFEGLRKVLHFAGIAEAPKKACAPATVMTFLGVQFDTVELRLTITPDRLVEIQALLASWEGANRLELQSLLGKLQFAAGCVRPGRIFVSRLLNFLRTTKESGSFVIPPDARADIAWWQKFMPT